MVVDADKALLFDLEECKVVHYEVVGGTNLLVSIAEDSE
jgi:hypothetical protein